VTSSARPSAAVRIQARLVALVERAIKTGALPSQKVFGDLVGLRKSGVTRLLKGAGTSLGPLARLDAIAEALGTSPAALVRHEGSTLDELSPDEERLLSHWRRLPLDAREAVLRLFDFYTGLEPDERALRGLVAKIRRFKNQADIGQVERTVESILKAQRRR